MNLKVAEDMIAQLQAYLQTAFSDRRGAMALAAMFVLLLILILRGWVLSPLTRRVKLLAKSDAQLVKKYYSKRSLWGWIFFLLSVFLALGLWVNPPQNPMTPSDLGAVLTCIFSLLMGIILHLMAIGSAALKALQDHKEPETTPPHAHQKNYSLS